WSRGRLRTVARARSLALAQCSLTPRTSRAATRTRLVRLSPLEIIPHRLHEGGVAPGQRRHRERRPGERIQLLREQPRPDRPLRNPLERLQRRFELGRVLRSRNAPPGMPTLRDEPRVARNPLPILRHRMIIIPAVTGQTTDLR